MEEDSEGGYHMYTMDSKLADLIKSDGVRTFIEKAAPKLLEEPVYSYVCGMTLTQIAGFQKEMKPLLEAIVDVANGKAADFTAVDPKKQKPVVKAVPFGQVYQVDDVDGALYMLERSFSGCIAVQFSKDIDERIPGTVTYEGHPVKYVLKKLAIAGNTQMLGIFVRDFATEYDKSYTLHLEDFTDTDGNVMDPADFIFQTAPQDGADPKYASHDAVAQQAAEEGMVLLKNQNNVLPLKADAHITMVGAEDFRCETVGAGKINPRYMVRLLQAVEESSFVLDQDADTVLMVISRASGENYDNGPFKGEFYLTEEEEQQIQNLENANKTIIAIINSGYPMDVRWTLDDHVSAAIWTGYPGMLGGRALVNILNGTINPSGHLTDTWALDYDDIPAAKNFYTPATPEEALDADHDVWVDTVYEEDIYVGYRYFTTFDKPVAYPFGHGLSYTSFDIQAKLLDTDVNDGETGESTAKTSSEKPDASFIISAPDQAGFYGNSIATIVQVTVTNTGIRSGRQVVQVYAQIPDGKLEQPSLQLVAFAKTKLLAPGEREEITLNIPENRLASFDEDASAYILEAGSYAFFVGTSVSDVTVIGGIAIDAKTLKTVGDYMKPPIDFTRLSKKDPKGTYPTGKLSGIVEGTHTLPHCTSRQHIPDREEAADPVVDTFSDEELARFSVCASAGWGMQDTGVAGKVYQLEGRDIPYYAVADGNNGVNVHRKNIGMPTSNLVCSTWDPSIARHVGNVIAEEARENNVQMILAPAMNIHRNPMNGRQPEYFSEDPLLAGIMAGNQDLGLEEKGVDSSVKHVCCNNAESSRKRNHSVVSRRALREIYLRAFEEALRIHKPASIMTSYNACNGVFTAEDEELLQGIFRGEFGFEGFVMTDWTSYDTVDVAKACEAGVSWFTPGSGDDTYTKPILEGLANGTIDRNRLRQNVRYMYRVVKSAESKK